jgi:hypothetical protein
MYYVCPSVLEIIPSPPHTCNVEGVAGAGILFFLNISHNRPQLMLLILLIIVGFGVEFPLLYLNDSHPNCQFALASVICIMYSGFLKETNFKIALTMHLPSWRTDLKQINIQN